MPSHSGCPKYHILFAATFCLFNLLTIPDILRREIDWLPMLMTRFAWTSYRYSRLFDGCGAYIACDPSRRYARNLEQNLRPLNTHRRRLGSTNSFYLLEMKDCTTFTYGATPRDIWDNLQHRPVFGCNDCGPFQALSVVCTTCVPCIPFPYLLYC